jgi:hypothetical protein
VLVDVPCNLEKNVGSHLTHLNSFEVCTTHLTKSIGETQCLNLVYDGVKFITKLIGFPDITRLRLYEFLHKNLYVKYFLVMVWIEKEPGATHLEFTPIK